MLEQILTDLHVGDPEMECNAASLFQSDRSASVRTDRGEVRKGIPNNLVPYIAQVAVGKLKCTWGIRR